MLYIVFLLLSISIVFQVGSLNDEGHALLSLKKSIYRDPEGSLISWNSSDESPCAWNGVTCKGQRVASLSIPRKNLYGVLPSALGSLSELRRLNLRNNELFGSLPVELFQVLGLQSLVLCGNSLSGELPKEVGRLRFLQSLDLSDNFFNWSLPISVLECKRLRTLDLSHNNFSGGLLNGFGVSLVSLENFDISFNQFNGSIPRDIGNLSSLQGTVDLSHNLFTGSIPASLGNLPEKVYIDLSYNNLCGPIPQYGSLINRGPTAFVGNPGLCGPPLKNHCPSDMPAASSPSPYPFMPSNYTPHVSANAGKSGKVSGLSKGAVIAVVVSNVIGMSLIALLLSYCYSRVCVKGKKDKNVHGPGKVVKRREDLLCFRNNRSGTLSENVEQCDLVPLDHHVTFDLDELLKASAFVLGKGRFGIVYKVVLEDGQTLAVRRLGEGGSQRFKEFQAEVEAIARIRHPNIVALRAYYWSVDEKLLIYDYIPHGNLATAIHGKRGMVSFTPLPWSIRLKIIKGVAKGLFYLHEFSPKRFVHGDLRLSNILLGDRMEPKISDFGLGRLASIAERSPTPEQQKETLDNATSSEAAAFSSSASMRSYYQAPEALKVAKPSQKWDVYAFGVIILELITGRLPMVQVGTSSANLVHWMQQCIAEKKPLLDVLDPYLIDDIDKEDEIIAVLKIAMACIHSSPERRTAMRHVIDALDRVTASAD